MGGPTVVPPLKTSGAETTQTLKAETKPAKRRVPHRMRADIEREELFMQRMQSKQDFNPNPRFTKVMQKAATREGHSTMTGVRRDDNSVLPFGVSPAVVEFDQYTVGGVYFADVTITSSATISCRLRTLPPTLTEFSATPLQFPMNEDGQLAPGMSCHCKVIFAPVHLAELEDTFSIATQLGIIHIRLVGKRPAPQLVMPRTINMGPCLLGSDVSCVVPIENIGGTGRFTVLPVADCLHIGALAEDLIQHHSWLETPEDEWPEVVPIELDGFRVDGSGFRLAEHEAAEIKVTFLPEQHGQLSQECLILCDDCTYVPIKFTGVGSAPLVKISAIDSIPFETADSCKPLPSELDFGCLSVSGNSSKRIKLSNSGEMTVSITWLLFAAPDAVANCAGLPGVSESNAIVQSLESEPEGAAFSVSPSSAVLKENESIEIEITYNPQQAALTNTLARLVVTEPISSMEQVKAEFLLQGQAELCQMEVSPPVVFFSGTLLMGKEYERTFSVTNNGQAASSFNWQDGHPSVSITPVAGVIEAQQSLQFQMKLMCAAPMPQLQVSRECTFDKAKPIAVFGEASVKGPEIHIEENGIDFGIVALRNRVSYNVTLTNSSEIPAQWLLSEAGGLEGRESEAVREFFFVPAHGCIAPMSSDVVTVCFKPSRCGRVDNFIEIHTEDEHTQYVRVNAVVHQPKACLNVNQMDLGTTYLGVKERREVVVRNLSMLPTHVKWAIVQINGLDMTFDPPDAVLEPGKELVMNIVLEPTKSGPLEALLMCEVEGMEMPLGLELKTVVATLEIEYGIKNEPPVEPDQLTVHFGDKVPIFSAPRKTLLIRNKSAIPAPFKIFVEKFGAVVPEEDGAVKKKAAKNTKAPSSKGAVSFGDAFAAATGARRSSTDRSAKGSNSKAAGESFPFRSDHGRSLVAARIRHAQEQSALAHDHGIAVGLSLATGVVDAWETVEIVMTCFSNMPGHYKDIVRCEVSDLTPACFPMSVVVCGSPIQFDPTTAGLKLPPDLGFGDYYFDPNLTNAAPQIRVLTLLNSSPFEVEAKLRIVSESKPFKPADVELVFGDDGRATAQVKPHDLQELGGPFSVSKPTVIIPAKGSVDFDLTLSVGETAEKIGQCLIVDPLPSAGHPHALLERHMLPANYLNLGAVVIDPHLSTLPKAKLQFQCLSSNDSSHPTRTRAVTLTNNTCMGFGFSLSTIGPFRIQMLAADSSQSLDFDDANTSACKTGMASTIRGHTCALKPTEGVVVSLQLIQEPDENPDQALDTTSYSGQLVVTYDSGSIQEYTLAADIVYPAATLCESGQMPCTDATELNFGIVRVGSHATSTVIVTALTSSSSQWVLTDMAAAAIKPPRRGSISTARRSMVATTSELPAATQNISPQQASPFSFKVVKGFFSTIAELRVWKQGGEVVTKRQRIDVGGWLGSLSTEDAHTFYELAAGKTPVPPNPWGSKILDWIEYSKGCSAEDTSRIKEAIKGTDTYAFLFAGDDFAHWYQLRKNSLRAGFLEGRPEYLKESPSEATLQVSFSPEYDEVYNTTFMLTLEHNRQYRIVLNGQGTNDEELL